MNGFRRLTIYVALLGVAGIAALVGTPQPEAGAVAAPGQSAVGAERSDGVGARAAELIRRAGNAEWDAERLELLRQARAVPDLPPALRTELDALIAAVDEWIHTTRLTRWPPLFARDGPGDFRLDSPLYPIVLFYRGRVRIWQGLESGSVWSRDERRVRERDRTREMFREAVRAFPQNRIARMYLGDPILSEKQYLPVQDAPEWAVYQREALERLAEIIRWWIEHRMQLNGEYGGGWGDDCDWMDTWVDAAARAERGKPAGVIPSAIHWPDGRIGGLGRQWWDPENHTNDPLYVWPSAMSMMTSTLLLTHQMTGDAKYLEPIRAMARIRLEYLRDPPAGEPVPGSAAWCASRMRGITEAVGKYRLLTGSPEFDELIRRDSSPYLRFRLDGDEKRLTEALRDTAGALRVNFPGYTSEVRYTDRVLRFPHLFTRSGWVSEPLAGFHAPDTGLLLSTVTGEPADGLYFPVNAVRWLTPPREIAVRVTATGRERFEAELFHFGTSPRPMAAELYLLQPGPYTMSLMAVGTNRPVSSQAVTVSGKRTRVEFALPARTPCALRVARQ